jgi:hypothetical protein
MTKIGHLSTSRPLHAILKDFYADDDFWKKLDVIGAIW